MALLKEQGLEQYKDEIATSLPYGLQRRLEIARALATEPKLLLLDEPAAGMNPQETQELAEYINTHSIPASRRFSTPAVAWLASRSATVRRLSSFCDASPAFV